MYALSVCDGEPFTFGGADFPRVTVYLSVQLAMDRTRVKKGGFQQNENAGINQERYMTSRVLAIKARKEAKEKAEANIGSRNADNKERGKMKVR